MPTEKKAQLIDKLKDLFAKSGVGIFADYRGMTVAELTDLRRNLRKSGVHFHVVKNTLARIAAEKAGKKDLGSLFEGPMAVAFSTGEDTIPAKVLNDLVRTGKTALKIKGGFLGDKLLRTADVQALAMLPPREIIIAQIVAGIQSPIAALVAYLSSPMSGLVGMLQARMKQLEGK
ncbi:MAG: 50S ribosomal protein L10 [Chloroflexota bacterium]